MDKPFIRNYSEKKFFSTFYDSFCTLPKLDVKYICCHVNLM